MAGILRKTIFTATFALFLLLGTKALAANIAVVEPWDGLNFRTGPGFEHNIIRALPQGTRMTILEDGVEWCPVRLMDGTEGWVAAQFIEILPELSSRSGGTASITAERLVAYATSDKFIGIPYKYGGSTTNGFDCSGFTQYIYSEYGFSIPHNAQSQFSYGQLVEKAELVKGDLVFFGTSSSNISHVGIYIGGNDFVHARSTGRPLGINSLNEDYYTRMFVGAKRLLAN